MNSKTKAILTLLIAEIQSCEDITQVNELLDCWIKTNDLHPEAVKTYNSIEELKQALIQILNKGEKNGVRMNCKFDDTKECTQSESPGK